MGNIGKRIKAARKKAGLTQIELAEMAGIAVNSLRLYEADKREPKISTLVDISRALNKKFTVSWPSGGVLFYSHALCWDEPCFKGYPICCYDCEEYEDCPEACDMAESCRKDEE